MRSHFSAQSLAEIFRDLYLEEWSGRLVLQRGEESKCIHWDRGMIYFAESPDADESLGPFLLREGVISKGALMEAQASLKGLDDNRELAAALVNRDLLARDTLDHAVGRIVERVVCATFRWPGGTARYEAGRPAAAGRRGCWSRTSSAPWRRS